MKSEIQKVVDKAVKEDWFNEMTTSDLQSVCEAAAMEILRKNQVNFVAGRDAVKVMNISDKILNGIYKQAETN